VLLAFPAIRILWNRSHEPGFYNVYRVQQQADKIKVDTSIFAKDAVPFIFDCVSCYMTGISEDNNKGNKKLKN
jgi:hypothetical protein